MMGFMGCKIILGGHHLEIYELPLLWYNSRMMTIAVFVTEVMIVAVVLDVLNAIMEDNTILPVLHVIL